MIFTLTLNPAVDKELQVPAIEAGQVLRAQSVKIDYGGKGFNVSRMLKSLGSSSTALGFIGGKTGEVLQSGLDKLGVKTDFVLVNDETRTNISIVPKNRSQYVKVNEPGPLIRGYEVRNLVDKIKSLVNLGDWWVLAGSLPRGLDAGFYAELIGIIQEGGGKVVLDTSGEALKLGCQQKCFLAKPNVDEAQSLTGVEIKSVQDAREAASKILEMGVQHVVISLGKSGALWMSSEKSWVVNSPPIVEQNPIGAGDSMVGGIVWGLAYNYPYEECLRWGVACGAAAASLDGTAIGESKYVEELVEQTRFYQL